MNIRDEDFGHGGAEHEPPSTDLQAGEYVLGVLDAEQRRQAQARIDAEPAFARLVLGWEQRLGGLLAEIEPVPAPPHVWLRVRNQLGWAPMQGAPEGMLQRVGFWRGATAVALATAAALAVVSLLRPPAPPASVPAPTQVVVAPEPVVAPPIAPAPITTLAQDDGSPAYLASIDVEHSRVRIMPLPADPDSEGRVPELWLIPPGEAARSLGVIDTRTAREIDVPEDLRVALDTGSILAITLEPPGGAPQGVATGPIVAKGEITLI